MKKLLYTLLLGLIVISCNKDDVGAENISVLAPEQEIQLSQEARFEFAYSFINSLAGKEGPKVDASSARNTSNYINVAFLSANSRDFSHMVSEDQITAGIDPCYDNYTVTRFEYSYAQPTLTVYDLDTDESQDYTLSSGLFDRYDAVFGQSLNTMQNIEYVNENPKAVLGAQPSKNGDYSFTAN